ncbi:glycogen/starch/alpha-glucan phosphorylase, partial [Rhodoferax sp.]|uniref:glycogen/starch/alpha-glucan phosphorylase n=1 Tax=Rhodoferax sp. TaxID=50421 RepID=UPI0027732F12|nr:glycogen/starch/alpha-glucan phosphorylase [Rhodoferax sp.]
MMTIASKPAAATNIAATTETNRGAPDAALRERFKQALASELDLHPGGVTRDICLRAAASSCRDLLAERWAQTQREDSQAERSVASRRVHYLSMEFLMGRALGNALAALGLDGSAREALAASGLQLSDTLEQENDAALGNGGLGRLAACFLDSFAELGLPSFGYGLRYQYGMFAQQIQDGKQVESPDDWMRQGNPWEIARPEVVYRVGLGGRVEAEGGARRWVPAEWLSAQAFDFVVPAHQSQRVSTLRQWHASAERAIDFAAFCAGDYVQAARHRVEADALNWVLYPDDSTASGRALRLKQEAFLVSASMQDIVARHLRERPSLDDLGLRNAIHLNDT